MPVGEVVARTSSSWMDGADVGMEGESILQRSVEAPERRSVRVGTLQSELHVGFPRRKVRYQRIVNLYVVLCDAAKVVDIRT